MKLYKDEIIGRANHSKSERKWLGFFFVFTMVTQNLIFNFSVQSTGIYIALEIITMNISLLVYCLGSKGDSYNSFKNGDSLIDL